MSDSYRLHTLAAMNLRADSAGHDPKPLPCKVTKVDHALWLAAMGLADGDVSRLRVEDDGTVIVLNHGRRRR